MPKCCADCEFELMDEYELLHECILPWLRVELDEMLGGILRIKKQGAMFCVPLSNISHYVITDQEAKQCEDGTNPALSVKVSPLPSKRGYSG